MSVGSRSIMASWRSPSPPNGQITHYSLVLQDGETQNRTRVTVKNGRRLTFEFGDLIEKRLYQAYVTASTKIGESLPSRIVTMAPSSKSWSSFFSL